MKMTNPDGIENVRLHGIEHKKLLQPPPVPPIPGAGGGAPHAGGAPSPSPKGVVPSAKPGPPDMHSPISGNVPAT